jgi:hypothetical protein
MVNPIATKRIPTITATTRIRRARRTRVSSTSRGLSMLARPGAAAVCRYSVWWALNADCESLSVMALDPAGPVAAVS